LRTFGGLLIYPHEMCLLPSAVVLGRHIGVGAGGCQFI
jgi:hypothetical protein